MKGFMRLFDSPKCLMTEELYLYLHKKNLDELDEIDHKIQKEIADLKSLCIN